MRRIVFECSRLVGTDCSVPEDVIADEREMSDHFQLLIIKTKKTEFPSSGILIRNNNLIEETGRKKVFGIDVLLKFDIKGDKIDKLPNDNLVAEYQKSGSVKIGVNAQKGLTSSITGLNPLSSNFIYIRFL